MRTRELFRYKYENGNEVQVTNKGVTLWDTRTGQWVIDASTLAEESAYRVAHRTCEHQEFPSLYTDHVEAPKKKAAKKPKTKKRAKRK